MSLLQDNTIPVIPTPDNAAKLARKVNNIQGLSRETFNKLINTQRQGIDQLWNDSTLSPQTIINGLSGDAVKVFQFHGLLTTFIQSLADIDSVDVELKFPTNAFTITDGVITVLDTPYIP